MALFSVLFSDGFRKVIGAEQGGLRSDKDEWEFFNQNFQQRQPELLEHVKRKVSRLSVVWLKGAQGTGIKLPPALVTRMILVFFGNIWSM